MANILAFLTVFAAMASATVNQTDDHRAHIYDFEPRDPHLGIRSTDISTNRSVARQALGAHNQLPFFALVLPWSIWQRWNMPLSLSESPNFHGYPTPRPYSLLRQNSPWAASPAGQIEWQSRPLRVVPTGHLS
ncbi:hypothetical protein H257_02972 [Aphanomyces astaci]|uniref:RxLR effector protein n=1 Tax=Aphanomyces astaci TaxID=112090 RepID=W4H0N8_APHAT|nr:hypothetical protein H257_02972 [Aphanomyces astaci]ETV85126.1 hypothetical protein H257_02972 [Aphanomyces astaci]|eukprot:XP_009825144.1 hypothetical protein H257_02972 [Aphanomyces astaci]